MEPKTEPKWSPTAAKTNQNSSESIPHANVSILMSKKGVAPWRRLALAGPDPISPKPSWDRTTRTGCLRFGERDYKLAGTSGVLDPLKTCLHSHWPLIFAFPSLLLSLSRARGRLGETCWPRSASQSQLGQLSAPRAHLNLIFKCFGFLGELSTKYHFLTFD